MDLGILYKYRSLDGIELGRVKETIEHNSIYFPSPDQFNDPFDCAIPLSLDGTEDEWRKYILKNLKRRMPDLSPADRLAKASRVIRSGGIEKLDPAISTRQAKSTGIYCLSAVNDDIPMWSHYASAHTGICLGFRTGPTDKFFLRSQEVKYSEAYPLTRIFDSDEKRMETALLTKSNHWEYEKEYRIIEPLGPGKYTFSGELLVAVIMGCNIRENDERAIRNWVEARTPKPKLSKARKKNREYGLLIEEVN